MNLIYPAIFIPCLENPSYMVEVLDLSSYVSEGSCLENAIEMGTDAARGWILGE